MSWPSFDPLENDCYNPLMIDSYDIEPSEWGSPSCDQAWELDSSDYQLVDQIALNNFLPFESEKIRRIPPEIIYIQREKFSPSPQQTNCGIDIETIPQAEHFPKKAPNIHQVTPLAEPEKKPLRLVIKVVNKAKKNAEAPSEEDIDYLSSQNPKKRKSTSKETKEPKRRKIVKLEIAPPEHLQLDAANEEVHTTHRPLRKKRLKNPTQRHTTTLLRIEKRREAYLQPPPPILISEPSKVDIKLAKYIRSHYGKIPPRKNTETYAPLLNKKIVISKLNTIDDHIKELALNFFKNNLNTFTGHLTKMFDVLLHKALVDDDKNTLKIYMDKYLNLDKKSFTITKDRVAVMDRLMKELKRILNEFRACEAGSATFKNKIVFIP